VGVVGPRGSVGSVDSVGPGCLVRRGSLSFPSTHIVFIIPMKSILFISINKIAKLFKSF